MGKLRSFYVELLDPQQVYFAGQTINGRLVVELDAEMKMRGFKQQCNNTVLLDTPPSLSLSL